MMNMNKHPASGAASAHRYNLAPSTTNFKTRKPPCGIAVRAGLKKSMDSTGKRSGFGVIWTSSGDQQTRIPSFDPVTLRFTENRTLKTEHPEQRCQLRFPYGTGRCYSNGLLEQMP
jgi:hypothetical protein